MGKQTAIDELKDKHEKAIKDKIELSTDYGVPVIDNAFESATACTTITLQTVVEVLEDMKEVFKELHILNAEKLCEIKLIDYINLLNQNK